VFFTTEGHGGPRSRECTEEILEAKFPPNQLSSRGRLTKAGGPGSVSPPEDSPASIKAGPLPAHASARCASPRFRATSGTISECLLAPISSALPGATQRHLRFARVRSLTLAARGRSQVAIAVRCMVRRLQPAYRAHGRATLYRTAPAQPSRTRAITTSSSGVPASGDAWRSVHEPNGVVTSARVETPAIRGSSTIGTCTEPVGTDSGTESGS
jgi:hypothetical protein